MPVKVKQINEYLFSDTVSKIVRLLMLLCNARTTSAHISVTRRNTCMRVVLNLVLMLLNFTLKNSEFADKIAGKKFKKI